MAAISVGVAVPVLSSITETRYCISIISLVWRALGRPSLPYNEHLRRSDTAFPNFLQG